MMKRSVPVSTRQTRSKNRKRACADCNFADDALEQTDARSHAAKDTEDKDEQEDADDEDDEGDEEDGGDALDVVEESYSGSKNDRGEFDGRGTLLIRFRTFGCSEGQNVFHGHFRGGSKYVVLEFFCTSTHVNARQRVQYLADMGEEAGRFVMGALCAAPGLTMN